MTALFRLKKNINKIRKSCRAAHIEVILSILIEFKTQKLLDY